MADKIKKGDWSAQTTAILLIVAPILVMLFNSLGPVKTLKSPTFCSLVHLILVLNLNSNCLFISSH